jgi:hypothetical protein
MLRLGMTPPRHWIACSPGDNAGITPTGLADPYSPLAERRGPHGTAAGQGSRSDGDTVMFVASPAAGRDQSAGCLAHLPHGPGTSSRTVTGGMGATHQSRSARFSIVGVVL